jgi:hypothetical protein
MQEPQWKHLYKTTWSDGLAIRFEYDGVDPILLKDRDTQLAVMKAFDEMTTAFRTIMIRNDPKFIASAAEEKTKLLALFPQPIFVEEIPNQYSNEPYYILSKWYVVTTTKGRITIGWRKRVIVIDWEGSAIQSKAGVLFPDTDNTKSDKMIHAWNYDEAKEFLNIILAAQ